MSTYLAYAAAAAAVYIATCQTLRFRNRDSFYHKLNPAYARLSQAELYEQLTLSDAEKINRTLARYEFPKVYNTALQFALFRTYAIPSISSVLKKTKQLAEKEFAGRRYSDTVVLIAEFTAWPLDSERSSLAIARMNYLHSLYPSILPRDILYTLLLFATQPLVFIARLEWRTPTPLEKVAAAKYWTEVGVRMGIPREDIPKTFEEMVVAYEEFEKEYMVPAESNNYVGKRTMELLLYWVPTEGAKWFGKQVVLALLDEKLRTAMMFEDTTELIKGFVKTGIELRRFILRWLCLPRYVPYLIVNEKRNNRTGRYYVRNSDNEPWYQEPTLWNRWGPWGIIARIGGWPLPGDQGFKETGYELHEVGPATLEKSGHEKVKKEAERIRGMGGCPFAV